MVLLSVLLLTSCGNSLAVNTKETKPAAILTADNPISTPKQPVLEPLTEQSAEQDTEKLTVSFLNVGQADCTLITLGEETLLIDAGDAKSGDKIVEYMQKQNIDDIDYFVTTHPHADHIGSAVTVMNHYPVDILLMPDAERTTKTYQNFITYIEEKDCQKIVPNQHDVYNLGNASFEILSPNDFPYNSNINNASIVLKLNYKDNSFLFMGDAEAPLENALMQNIGANLKADVIKVGHHGSSSSTTESFIQYVLPEIAVISAGQNNQYGHPAQQILNLLIAMNAEVYRTDLDGTITLTSNGEEITVKTHDDIQNNNNVQDSDEYSDTDTNTWSSDEYSDTDSNTWSSNDTENNIEIVVYITNTGTKYHNSGCRYLSKSKIPISLENAQTDGYTPCKVCNPAA